MTRKKKILVLEGAGIAVLVAVVFLWQVACQPTEVVYAEVQTDSDANVDSFDYAKYTAALKQVDDQGLVNYKKLKEQPEDLDAFITQIAQLDGKNFAKWQENDQIAFWINAYNGLTLQAIVAHYPIKPSLLGAGFPKNSIRQIQGVWDKLKFNVMGKKVTLNDIEHEILRKKHNTPEIHMALVCAAISCPPLLNKPFIGETLTTQFSGQAKAFLATEGKFNIDRKKKTVYLSKIFDWFGDDFLKNYSPAKGFKNQNKKMKASLHYISLHLSKGDAEYLNSARYKVKFLDYDWTLNEKKPKQGEAAAPTP
jgi:hypothetical protein